MLNFFKARDEIFPEDGDREEGKETDAGDGVSQPIGDFEAGEVGEGVEKDRGQSENECRPDDDAEGARFFGEEEKQREKKREGDEVDDDRKDDRRGRTDEVVDEIVIRCDERASKVEQVQVREAKGYRDGVSKRLHSLFSFKMR